MKKYHQSNSTKKFFAYIQHEDWPISHTHDYWEFLIVIEGSLIHKINGKQEFLIEHDLCCIRPSDIHSLHNLKKKSSCHIGLRFPSDFFENYCNLLSKDLFAHISNSEQPFKFQLKLSTINRIIASTHKAFTTSSLDDYESYCLVLFFDIFRAFYYNLLEVTANNEIKSTYSNLTAQLVKAMNKPNNFQKDLSTLFNDLHYSYSHSNRIFTKEVGMSPSEYFKAKKFNYAQQLLTETNIPIIDIAKNIGYQSSANFITAFKREFNISPNEYRLNYKAPLSP